MVARYIAGERIGVTRNGKLAAAVGVADPKALEALEMAQDVTTYRHVVTVDDGVRVNLVNPTPPTSPGSRGARQGSRLSQLPLKQVQSHRPQGDSTVMEVP